MNQFPMQRALQCSKAHIFTAIIFAAITGVCFGQVANTPGNGADLPKLTYDVASIRQAHVVTTEGARIDVTNDDPPHEARYEGKNLPLGIIIEEAYGLRSGQRIGSPDWVDRTMFTVEARSDGPDTEVLSKLPDRQAELVKQKMLQDLLATRFHLQTHTETREQTVYVLTVSKKGPKLQASQQASTGDAKADAEKNAPFLSQKLEQRGWQVDAKHLSMAEITEVLEDSVSTDILDKTGLSGKYDFTLQFKGKLPGEESDNGTTDWPPLTTAVEETLGLKLERGKGPVQVLVIDYVEKPTEN